MDDTLLDLLGGILTDLYPDTYVFSESPDGRLFAAHGIEHYSSSR